MAQNNDNTKHMILDTNILAANPDALYAFKPKEEKTKNQLIIPIWVIKELEKFKKELSERGKNSRYALRLIDQLQEKTGCSYRDGIPIDGNDNYSFRVEIDSDFSDVENNHSGLENILGNDSDSKSLKLALKLMGENKQVEVITLDTAMRVIGKSYSINVSTWKDITPISSIDDIYKGWKEVRADWELINRFEQKNNMVISPAELDLDELFPNQYFILNDFKSPGRKAYAVYKPDQKGLVNLVYNDRKNKKNKITPRTPRQRFLMEALQDPDINRVIAIGSAGTGKTFLELEAAARRTHPRLIGKNKNHSVRSKLGINKILVWRSIKGLDEDENPGFLPGDIDDKLELYKKPINQNLYKILDLLGVPDDEIDEYITKVVEFDSLYHVRGTTVENSFVIIDEAQNLSLNKIKTLAGRIGEYTKVAINGDLAQMDTKFGYSNNGLTMLNETHKQSPSTATIYFPDEDCVRSNFARESLIRLNQGYKHG